MRGKDFGDDAKAAPNSIGSRILRSAFARAYSSNVEEWFVEPKPSRQPFLGPILYHESFPGQVQFSIVNS